MCICFILQSSVHLPFLLQSFSPFGQRSGQILLQSFDSFLLLLLFQSFLLFLLFQNFVFVCFRSHSVNFCCPGLKSLNIKCLVWYKKKYLDTEVRTQFITLFNDCMNNIKICLRNYLLARGSHDSPCMYVSLHVFINLWVDKKNSPSINLPTLYTFILQTPPHFWLWLPLHFTLHSDWGLFRLELGLRLPQKHSWANSTPA